MKRGLILSVALAFWLCADPVAAEEIAISYPGLTGELASLWMAGGDGFFQGEWSRRQAWVHGGKIARRRFYRSIVEVSLEGD